MSKFAKAIKFVLNEFWGGLIRPTGKQREAMSDFYRNAALGLYGVTAYFLWRDGFEKPFFTTIVLIIATASLIGSFMILGNPKSQPDKAETKKTSKE